MLIKITQSSNIWYLTGPSLTRNIIHKEYPVWFQHFLSEINLSSKITPFHNSRVFCTYYWK